MSVAMVALLVLSKYLKRRVWLGGLEESITIKGREREEKKK